jgi:hypothetical protein
MAKAKNQIISFKEGLVQIITIKKLMVLQVEQIEHKIKASRQEIRVIALKG